MSVHDNVEQTYIDMDEGRWTLNIHGLDDDYTFTISYVDMYRLMKQLERDIARAQAEDPWLKRVLGSALGGDAA